MYGSASSGHLLSIGWEFSTRMRVATACTGAGGLKVPGGGALCVGMLFASIFLSRKMALSSSLSMSRVMAQTGWTTWRGGGGSGKGAEEEKGAERARECGDQDMIKPRGRAPAPALIPLISLTATPSPIWATRAFDSVPISPHRSPSARPPSSCPPLCSPFVIVVSVGVDDSSHPPARRSRCRPRPDSSTLIRRRLRRRLKNLSLNLNSH